MATKLTRLTHKIAIQLNLAAERCTICSSRSRRPVRKSLDTPSYVTGIVVTKFWQRRMRSQHVENKIKPNVKTNYFLYIKFNVT